MKIIEYCNRSRQGEEIYLLSYSLTEISCTYAI